MMSEPKSEITILCLANSRRPGGSCIAGKEFRGGKAGSWVRPISNRNTHEISALEQRCTDGKALNLLDVVSIPTVEPRPIGHQTENRLIQTGKPWERKSQATWEQIVAAA